MTSHLCCPGFPLYISEAARRDLAIDFAEWAVFAVGGDAVVRCAAIQPYGGTHEICECLTSVQNISNI